MTDARYIRTIAGALGSALIAAGGVAVAQDRPVPDPVIERQAADETLSSAWIGLPVITREGGEEQQIGAVEELLLDDEHALTGLVVEIGGFLGLGATRVALSADALDLRDTDGTPTAAVVYLTRAQLESAPTFKTWVVQQREREQERLRDQQRQQSDPLR